MSDYTPISCSLHDQFEAFATTRRRVLITFTTESGEVATAEDVLTDWVVRAGVEYLQTAGGLEVRMDRVVTIGESES